MRISDWSSDVCSSDLSDIDAGEVAHAGDLPQVGIRQRLLEVEVHHALQAVARGGAVISLPHLAPRRLEVERLQGLGLEHLRHAVGLVEVVGLQALRQRRLGAGNGTLRLFPRGRAVQQRRMRSEEHTSELQSLMRISYAVFCLQKKTHKPPTHKYQQ